MARFLFSRLNQMIAVLFVVSVVIFLLFRVLIPGDPVALMLGPEYTEESYSSLKAHLGLDRPLLAQYLIWISGLLRGDLGESFLNGTSVRSLIATAFPVSLQVAAVSVGIATVLSVLVAVASAVQRDSVFDHAVRTLAVAGIALPTQWLGVLVILLFAVKLRWLPAGGFARFFEGPGGWAKFVALPILVVALQLVAEQARYLRSSLLEILSADYIRTARSKGLPERSVLYTHALRNAVITVITIIGLNLAKLTGGLIIVEQLFNLPGMGWLLVRSIANRDFPTIQGVVLVAALIYTLVNLLVDILYGVLDPRIRHAGP